MNNWESLGLLLLLMAIVWLVDRKKFKKEGIMYLRRTQRGLDIIDAFAKKYTKYLRSMSDFAVVFSFGYLGLKYIYNERKIAKENKSIWPLFLSYTLIMSIIAVFLDPLFSGLLSFFNATEGMIAFVVPGLKILTFAFGVSGYAFFSLFLGAFAVALNAFGGNDMQSPISLVLPVQVPESYGLPVYSVPLIPWLISIFVILVVHEFSHAIISRVEGIRVKAMGYGFMLIMPLGFAEPDEKQIEKSSSLKKTRIYAAGSFANFVTACLFILIMIGTTFAAAPLLKDMQTQAGVGYGQTQEGYPASEYMPVSGVITNINSVPVYNLTDFTDGMSLVVPGENITLIIDNEPYNFPTVSDPRNESNAYVGITQLYILNDVKEELKGTSSEFFVNAINYIYELFGWIILLNIGIGIANLMPLKPFDGGLVAEEVIKGSKVPKARRVSGVVGQLMLAIILFALFGPLAIKGFTAFLGLF